MNKFINTLAVFPDQIRVVLTNLLTYLMVLQTGVTTVVVGGYLDAWPEAYRYAMIGLSGLAAVITFIRRVTPVAKTKRGVLPVE